MLSCLSRDRQFISGTIPLYSDMPGAPQGFSMAFQPIVNTEEKSIFAYEALARGASGGPASEVFARVDPLERYSFDEACRIRAIELAARLGLTDHGARLAVNFLPGTVYSPVASIQRTLKAAHHAGFPVDRLILEITEEERVDAAQLHVLLTEYRHYGLTLALDDLGAGYSSLNLLTELDIDIVKLDAKLVRNLYRQRRAEHVVRAMVELCRTLGVQLIGEAVEREEEYRLLKEVGVTLMQGYLFARPAFEALPAVRWPEN